MEYFDVCLKMPISKITSVLNAKDVFYDTHCFKHVLRKKHVFLLSYSVLIDLHENLRGEGGWRVHQICKAVKLLYSYEKS